MIKARKNTLAILIIALFISSAIVPLVCAQAPVTIRGKVTFEDTTGVGKGWLVNVTNLDTSELLDSKETTLGSEYLIGVDPSKLNVGDTLEAVTQNGSWYGRTTYVVQTGDNVGFATIWMNVTVSEAAEVHDISVTTDYSGAVNGIKITRDGTDVVGEGEYLIIGETYNIRYKLVNEGDFNETGIAVTVKIDDDILATHTYSLNVGASNTYSDSWDTTGLTAGDYTITVNASIAVDDDLSDNERTRDVTLVTEAAPYGVDLTVDDETKSTIQNVNAAYTLTVENTGTLADDYTLTVDNPDGADVAALDTYTITGLAPGATQDVVLNVADANLGTYRVNVTVVSDTDPTNATDYVNTTTTVEEERYDV